MSWIIKLTILLVTAIPAFTGYPLNQADALIVAGITQAWAVYFIAAHLVVWGVGGRRKYARILTTAVLVTVPVVAAGACISFITSLFAADPAMARFTYSAHYLRLCITMLTVVPLAIGLVATIPLQMLEQDFLRRRRHVSMTQKRILMALRVFNHIVYYVIPNLLEVVKEERQFQALSGKAGFIPRRGRFLQRAARLVRRMVYIAGEAICAAVVYIPLWAAEIARLPSRDADPTGKRPQ